MDPNIYATHSPPKLTKMEDMDYDKVDAVDQVFDMDYNVAQAFCSHIVPKAVLLFMGEALDDVMDFETEDEEGYDNDDGDKGWDNEGGG